VAVRSGCLVWRRRGVLNVPLTIAIVPLECQPRIGNPAFWFDALVGSANADLGALALAV
jgi:hypothetical protein